MNAAEPQADDVPRPAPTGDSDAHRWNTVSSPERPSAPREGYVLAGRYKLLSRLGEGGMGSVWRARSMTLEVDVAVKVVKRSSTSPRACERLLREARAAASLANPSIVKVFDFGTTDEGEPFLVMQLLRGDTLRTWLHERGRLPATTAVQLLLPIAAALTEVHGLGIMHRDIKPENILVEEGRGGRLVPVLVDFGIAKHSHEDQDNFTQSGVLVGSPAYMSPEQARGNADPLSDVWSLCVVLYEMMTGKRPFDGVNHGAVLFAVFADEPVPTHEMGAGDEGLWRILHRGLAKARAERWQSVQELGRALAVWAAAHGVTEDSTGTSLAHQWLAERTGPAGEPEQTATQWLAEQAGRTHEPEQTRTRLPVLGLGAVVAVVAGILTFRALAPSAPPVAEITGPQAAGAAALELTAAATAEAPPAEAKAAVSAAPAVTPSAVASATPTATVQTPLRAAKTPAVSVTVVAPRRPPPAKAPMPLPSTPDF